MIICLGGFIHKDEATVPPDFCRLFQRIQIQDDAVCVLFSMYAFGKGMNSSVLNRVQVF